MGNVHKEKVGDVQSSRVCLTAAKPHGRAPMPNCLCVKVARGAHRRVCTCLAVTAVPQVLIRQGGLECGTGDKVFSL